METMTLQTTNMSISDNTEEFRSAAENGRYAEVKRYLESKHIDVNCKDYDGYTALHRACYEGHIEIARLLRSYNADIGAKTDDGWTPLHSACRWNQVQTASYLIHQGADVNAVTKGNNTPLHIAANCKNTKNIITLLLWHSDINLNVKNYAGDTAYDIARRTSNTYQLFQDKIKSFTKS